MADKVAVVTAGHLSTCPRMLKVADALAEEGYDVEVVATRSTSWATQADAAVLERRAGRWMLRLIDYTKSSRARSIMFSA